MPYSIEHVYVDINGSPGEEPVTGQHQVVRVVYSAAGDLPILHPGQLSVSVKASYTTISGNPPSGNEPAPKPSKITHDLPLSISIFSPDGNLFTANHVTLADLERFRNLREASQGTWRYQVSGVSTPISLLGPPKITIDFETASVRIAIEEITTSGSAGLLVSGFGSAAKKQVYSFDLFRVGQFEAEVRSGNVFSSTASLRLIDPDGVVAASASHGLLTFPVTLRTLAKSRDANGNVRPWQLEFTSTSAKLEPISATVVTTAQIPIAMLQQRIDDILGVDGKSLSIYGENKDGNALCRLKILDDFTVEALEINGVVDDVFDQKIQDPKVVIKDLQKDVAYTIRRRSQDLGNDLTIDVGGISITILRVRVGPSQHIQPSIPAITVDVAVQGGIDVNIAGVYLASLTLNNQFLTLEVGATVDTTGSIVLQSWITDDPIDIDVDWTLKVAAIVAAGPFGALAEAGVTAYIQSEVNDKIVDGFRGIVESAILSAPKIMAMLLGGDFKLKSLQMANNAIVFSYIAPVEPDPKPNPNYIGVIGRSAVQLGPHSWKFFPPSLGDTWAANNLSKINHIVVVMMENRSFDHILGYRQLVGDVDGDGGYRDLIQFLYDQGFPVTMLRNSGMMPDAAGFKTKFPAPVGHDLKAVAQQLASQLQTSFGSTVNSPQGFIDSFTHRVTGGLMATDVLGTYDNLDLPMTGFLAENYSYSERYFSSHPGPTMPNRMYSLGGDVQYDRVGEAILNNNNGDNLALSRACNIFDLLTRNNVSWRVYESFPSITMLRMFARYLGDNTNISPRSKLGADVASGNLPSVTFIDPAMHHPPENDDHSPFADLLDGQKFIKDIYDVLRSNAQLWQQTLLIVTYDEHGGFYDHVVPPTAEIRALPSVVVKGSGKADAAGDAATSNFKAVLMTPYGVRVPAFVVSPWVPPGKGPDITLDHCSILKTILARFCGSAKPFLSDRVSASQTFNGFLTQAQPRLSGIPASPQIPSPLGTVSANVQSVAAAISTKPVSKRSLREGDADFHELTGMLARMLGRAYVRTQNEEPLTRSAAMPNNIVAPM